jgi:hypothetical protein
MERNRSSIRMGINKCDYQKDHVAYDYHVFRRIDITNA